jgi:hypothetical protein
VADNAAMFTLRFAAAFAFASALIAVASDVTTPAHQVPSSTTPNLGHAVGYYDTRINRVVIVGEAGEPIDGTKDRMWSWSGTTWELMTVDGPTGRTNGAAAYLKSRTLAVVAGGARKTNDRWGTHGDAWIGDARGWQALPDISARDHHALVETRGGGVLMFGGIPAQRSAAWPSETFELNDKEWIRVATDGPVGRARLGLAFDRARNEVVLFGGVGAAPAGSREQPFFGDTWIWNGSAWRKAADTGPRGRYAHGMTYDEKRGVVLMYSGAAAHKDAPLTDMWQWDGTRWTEIALSGPTPGYRYQPVMVYDAARDRTVLVGGIGGSADTWEWDGTRWMLK